MNLFCFCRSFMNENFKLSSDNSKPQILEIKTSMKIPIYSTFEIIDNEKIRRQPEQQPNIKFKILSEEIIKK